MTDQSYDSITHYLDRFWQQAATAIQQVIHDSELQNYAFMLWASFSFIMLAHLLFQYVVNGTSLGNIIQTVLLIATVRILMNHYDDLTSALWDTSEGISSGIQRVTLGTSDLWFASGFIQDVMGAISSEPISWTSPVKIILATFFLYTSSCFLTIMAFVAATWSLWGYVMAKMIGFFMVPLILFERLSWLFDGWLRLFIGFLLYGILARINVILCVISIQAFFDLPSGQLPTGQSFFFSMEHMSDLIGLFCIMMLSIFALISSGKFVGIIAGGGSGFGQNMREIMHSISHMK
ncbi:MAG: type IV secretion system protein [Alphaproteobacteria bacterium]|nr:type IV secretion system protein [Alphaproteobacteria bacterium]